MDFHILEMLYSIPELQDLSYQIYRQIPERISQEKLLDQVWQECQAVPDPHVQELFHKLEDAENSIGDLQERAAFFAGLYFGQELSQSGL